MKPLRRLLYSAPRKNLMEIVVSFLQRQHRHGCQVIIDVSSGVPVICLESEYPIDDYLCRDMTEFCKGAYQALEYSQEKTGIILYETEKSK